MKVGGVDDGDVQLLVEHRLQVGGDVFESLVA